MARPQVTALLLLLLLLRSALSDVAAQRLNALCMAIVVVVDGCGVAQRGCTACTLSAKLGSLGSKGID